MSARFKAVGDRRIRVTFDDAERAFLLDLLLMLGTVGQEPDDPGDERLNVPAYLGDADASGERERMMGDQLADWRSRDRSMVTRLVADEGPVTLEADEALGLLRVINESRLVLAARLGIEVAADYESLEVGETIALHFLGLLLEDLAEELGSSFR